MQTIAIGGNPNCGKSALFNALTGIRQSTGNWPGVTVERKAGRAILDGREFTVVDLPGIYSLDAASLDEQVTRDYLLSHEAQLIVNVVDAANLERNLYFTVQLREMGLPMVVALNMIDVARKRGITVDVDRLAERLGCPVVPTSAVTGLGLDTLRQVIARQPARPTGFQVTHEAAVEEAITDLLPYLRQAPQPTDRRWLALKLLEGDAHAARLAGDAVQPLLQRLQQQIEQRSGEPADIHIADARYGHAHALAQQVVRRRGEVGRTLSDRIDRVVLNRFAGIPIFMLVMYLMFMFTINVGGAFIDLFDQAVGALLVDGAGLWLAQTGAPAWLQVLLADGIGGGVRIVSTFIPIIACLYLFLSALEDSGYMARAAFVMDRAMRAIGLPGKAFVPLIVGFGCNVPAVMATRTLENERERKLTILMNPFMSCGARLPVYALFVAAFFPNNGQNLVFLLYLIGILVAVATGKVMRHTLLEGESSGFMMELPPYHLPRPRGVLLRAWERVRSFVRDAGRVIILMVLALSLLSQIGSDGRFGVAHSGDSLLGAAGRAVTPLFAPMGIASDNWPATVGIFTGVLAKEVLVGTLDSLYGQIADETAGAPAAAEPFDLGRRLAAALATVPANLAALGDALLDPLGIGVGEIGDRRQAAAAQGVSGGIFGTMAERFDGRAGAFAYLLFILLYSPCVATIGAIVREAGRAWALFVVAWTSGIAYIAATLFYQAATFQRAPLTATGWLLGLSLLLVAVFAGLRHWGRRDARQRTLRQEIGA